MEQTNKFVTFSFDDGVEQDKKFVALLNEYGYKCTFNINTGIQTRANCWVNEGVKISRMNIAGLKELYAGHEVAVHSLTHPHLEELDEETVFNELYYDKKNIEEWFGQEVVGMAYPYGTYDERVISVAKKLGIRYARTAGTSMNFSVPDDLMKYRGTCHFANREIFRLIEKFSAEKADGERKILYIWGHTYEFDVMKKWEHIRSVFDALRGSDARFVCNREAFGLS